MLQNAKIYGGFWSPELILSYNRPFMFVTASRSTGKSTGVALHVLKEYIQYGKQFIYIRRTKDELALTCKSFFNNAVPILNDSGKYRKLKCIYYKNYTYYAIFQDSPKKYVCGYAIPLSLEEKFKSMTDYGNVWYAIYDEFISKDKTAYLGTKNNFTSEYDKIMSLYSTIDRRRGKAFRNELKFFFLGNLWSYYNPLFVALNITDYIRVDTKILAPKQCAWVVQQVKAEDIPALRDMENSNVYKLSNEKNRKYAQLNLATDSDTFVEKLCGPCTPICNMLYRNHKMGVYMFDKLGLIYVSNKVNNRMTFALTCGDQDKINYILSEKYNSYTIMKELRSAYTQGLIRFQDIKCKLDISNYFMLTD